MLIETLADLERWLKKEGLALRVGRTLDASTWAAWLTRNRGVASSPEVARGFGPTAAATITSAIADYESKRGGQK